MASLVCFRTWWRKPRRESSAGTSSTVCWAARPRCESSRQNASLASNRAISATRKASSMRGRVPTLERAVRTCHLGSILSNERSLHQTQSSSKPRHERNVPHRNAIATKSPPRLHCHMNPVADAAATMTDAVAHRTSYELVWRGVGEKKTSGGIRRGSGCGGGTRVSICRLVRKRESRGSTDDLNDWTDHQRQLGLVAECGGACERLGQSASWDAGFDTAWPSRRERQLHEWEDQFSLGRKQQLSVREQPKSTDDTRNSERLRIA